MADDPMTIDSASDAITIREGLTFRHFIMSGPLDYDAGTGSLLDLSSYFSALYMVEVGGCTALADNAIVPRYKNTDFTAEATGLMVFHWCADGVDGEVFKEVDDAEDLTGYQYQVSVIGAP